MKLGYMMVPQQRPLLQQTPQICRAEFAHAQGFSEFYATKQPDHSLISKAHSDSPEQSILLYVLPDLPQQPIPQVIAIDGERQTPQDQSALFSLAVPSKTAEQVRANIIQCRASLSVSWLSKTELAQHWSANVKGSTHAGLRTRAEDWRVARTIFVCDDSARAEAAVKSSDSPCRAYYRKLAKVGADDADIDALIDACVLYGTLGTVLDAIQDIAAASGPFGTLTLVDHAWSDTELAEQSIASLACAIAPVFQRTRVAI